MTKRLLIAAAVFFALFAGKPAEHCEKGHAVVYADGEVTFANGISADDLAVLQKTYGSHFAYFERDVQRYVITDPDTLDRIAAVYARQRHLGRHQDDLAKTTEKQIATIFDQAIRTGAAKRR
jgi:urate oxidase